MKLYASIDFFDEMCYAVWTPEMLDIYFRTMKSKGISRVYWIDQREIMMRSGCTPHSERMQLTICNRAFSHLVYIPAYATKAISVNRLYWVLKISHFISLSPLR